jgi:hypothetical protein
MASKKKADELKAKEARQKKILAVLGVLLVALMAIQGPKLMKHGSATAAPPPVTGVPTDGTLTTTPGSPLAPPSLAGVSTTAGAAPATGGTTDSDVAPAAQPGQLVQFDLFASKDPFVQQVRDAAQAASATASSSSGSSSGSGSVSESTTTPVPTAPAATDTSPFGGFGPSSGTDTTGGSSSDTGGATTTGPAAPAVPMTAVALISVNGEREEVQLGGDFPAAQPVFHLSSFDAASAGIGVVGGSYADDRALLTLAKGRAQTLQNTTDGTTYKLEYLGRKKVPTSSLPTTSTTTTTPATSSTTPTVTVTTTTSNSTSTSTTTPTTTG